MNGVGVEESSKDNGRRRRAVDEDGEELLTGTIQKRANVQPQREYLSTLLSRDVSQRCFAVRVECVTAAGA